MGESTARWISESLNQGTSGQWFEESNKQWISTGSLVQWNSISNQVNESMNHRTTESMNQWVNGQWINGPMTPWVSRWIHESLNQGINDALNHCFNDSVSTKWREPVIHCILYQWNKPAHESMKFANLIFQKCSHPLSFFLAIPKRKENSEVQTEPSLQSGAHFASFFFQKYPHGNFLVDSSPPILSARKRLAWHFL